MSRFHVSYFDVNCRYNIRAIKYCSKLIKRRLSSLTSESSLTHSNEERESFITTSNDNKSRLFNISHKVVDIMDDNSVSNIGVLTREEFLSTKRTNFIDKKAYDNLKPHEAIKYVTSKHDGFYQYDKTKMTDAIVETNIPSYKKIMEKSKLLSQKSGNNNKISNNDKLVFQDNKIYYKPTNEYYKSYFKDRERIFDGFNDTIKSIENDIIDSNYSNKNRTRISPLKYWIKPNYKSPSPDEINSLNQFDLKFVMMNEVKLYSKQKILNNDIWDSLICRILNVKKNININTLLRYLYAISIPKVESSKVTKLIDLIYSRKNEMKPKHFVFLFQAMSRLRIRDQRLFDDMYDMMLCWPILRNNFIIKAANSVSKLGISDNILSNPLKDVIANRINDLSGSECKRVKPITVFDLFDDDMIIKYLERCEYHKGYFSSYSRNIELIELYLRVIKPEVYSNLNESTREFIAGLRKEINNKKSCNNNDIGIMSNEHQDISRIMNNIGVYHQNLLKAGPYILDIYEPKSNIVIEVNNKYQYYRGTTQLTSSAKRRHEMISAMGFKLLHIPYKWWRRQESDENKIEFIRKLFINI